MSGQSAGNGARDRAVEVLRAHRQEHRPAIGDSTCICGGWAGPFTIAAHPQSYAHHLADALAEARVIPPAEKDDD